MSEYVSRKSDSTSKVPTQSLPANAWTLLEVEGLKTIVPKGNSVAGAMWAIYLNIDSPKLGGATELTFRWVRDPKQVNPKGAHDFTGQQTITVKKGGNTIHSAVWLFMAKKGQPVGVEITHNGSKPLTLKTRETKMSYEVGK